MRSRGEGGGLKGVAIGGLIGFVAFEASLGFALVDPGRIDWMLVAPGDFATHFLGWHLFRAEEWRWPLGATRSFIFPIGTSVGLTDSIPLLAIPLKAFRQFLREDFQFLGFWLLCSFVLQGVFGALLVRTRTGQVAVQACGAALFVLAPPLLARHGHAALTAHWLILGCLWVYYGYEDPRHSRRALLLLATLAFVAASVHPYLALMVMALSAAFYGRVVLQARERWCVGAFVPLGLLTALSALVFWQVGYFVLGEGALQAGGLTEYSMNALAPIMPMGGSQLLPDFFGTATAGQHEGFAYLGAGMLALSIIALVKAMWERRPLGSEARVRHLPLIAACTLLAVAALSPRVTAGETTIVHYSEAVWGPLQQFRAPGRLFWPAFYALMFSVIATTVARLPRKTVMVLLSAAVLLQCVDATRGFAYARALRELSWQSPLRTTAFWAAAPAHYRHLSLYPTNLCAAPLVALDYHGFALVAGRSGNTLNAGQATRLDASRVTDYCRFQTLEHEAGIVDANTLYVMSIRLAPGFARRATAPVACIDVDEFGICFAKDTYLQWQDAFDVNLAILPPPAELVRFRDALDVEFRDGLKRAPQSIYGSSEERVRAIARFVSYRLTGCDREEATGRILRELRGAHEIRLCSNHRSRRLSALENPGDVDSLPTRDETVRMLREVDDVYRKELTRSAAASHLDTEGEAVWIQEYLGYRLAGRSQADSHDLVLRDIRAVLAH
jgi:hypothetical protein